MTENIWKKTGSNIFEACNAVGKALGINVQSGDSLEEIAKLSHFRIRQVTLSLDWWKKDAGPFLGYSQKLQKFCAFIPKNGKYHIIIPDMKMNIPVTEQHMSQDLEKTAISFFRTLPDKALGIRDLFRFSFLKLKKEIQSILYLEILVGFLSLSFPIIIGRIMDEVLPSANIQELSNLLIAFFVCIIASQIFSITQNFCLLRIQYRTTIAIDAALMDRLLDLPLYFFRQFTSGDLASRMRGLTDFQSKAFNLLLQIFLNGSFSIFLLALMCYYSVTLALCALGLTILICILTIGYNIIRLKYEKKILTLEGKLSGFIFQALIGISKIRVSNSEERIFEVWLKSFLERCQYFIKSGTINNYFSAIQPFINVVSLLLIYYLAIQETSLSFGAFIAFSAAFGQLQGALLSLALSLSEVILSLPIFERVKPILTTLPEREYHKKDFAIIAGDLRLNNISFQYDQDSPLLFQNLNMHFPAGKTIALVGQTGSGKSTLFRLMLRFEKPNSGNIMIDGEDLEQINLKSWRKQMGVVLQTTTLMPGTLYENIVGFNTDITIEKAWEVARLALIDDDIKALPMGMHTLVLENGRTFSTGQKQRLLLARALIHDPKILLLDEATSSLDNKTQAAIAHNLSKIKSTIIMAAHRLSTVVSSDLIYVFENGRVIQQGNYEELVAIPGLFKEMVTEQNLLY